MSRLVDDLLSLARSDAGTWTIARETVDMDALRTAISNIGFDPENARPEPFRG